MIALYCKRPRMLWKCGPGKAVTDGSWKT